MEVSERVMVTLFVFVNCSLRFFGLCQLSLITKTLAMRFRNALRGRFLMLFPLQEARWAVLYAAHQSEAFWITDIAMNFLGSESLKAHIMERNTTSCDCDTTSYILFGHRYFLLLLNLHFGTHFCFNLSLTLQGLCTIR